MDRPFLSRSTARPVMVSWRLVGSKPRSLPVWRPVSDHRLATRLPDTITSSMSSFGSSSMVRTIRARSRKLTPPQVVLWSRKCSPTASSIFQSSCALKASSTSRMMSSIRSPEAVRTPGPDRSLPAAVIAIPPSPGLVPRERAGETIQSGLFGTDHSLGTNGLVVLLLGEVPERESGLLEGRALVMSLLGDLGGLVVADLGAQRGHE